MDNAKIIRVTRHWVEHFVIEMNLCPFARRELVNDRIRLMATPSSSEQELLEVLQHELIRLSNDTSIETTLLIHSNVLQSFDDYNGFLDIADQLLAEMKLVGVYQVASFHPDYQFEGTGLGDAENYTNRSPYPMLHLLREASLERAIDAYSEVDQIPVRNIELMNRLGQDKLIELLELSKAL